MVLSRLTLLRTWPRLLLSKATMVRPRNEFIGKVAQFFADPLLGPGVAQAAMLAKCFYERNSSKPLPPKGGSLRQQVLLPIEGSQSLLDWASLGC